MLRRTAREDFCEWKARWWFNLALCKLLLLLVVQSVGSLTSMGRKAQPATYAPAFTERGEVDCNTALAQAAHEIAEYEAAFTRSNCFGATFRGKVNVAQMLSSLRSIIN